MPRCFRTMFATRWFGVRQAKKPKKNKNNQRENLPRKAPNWVARTADFGSNSRIVVSVGTRGERGLGGQKFYNETGRCFRSHHHPMSFLRRKRSTSHSPRARASTVHHCTSLCASHISFPNLNPNPVLPPPPAPTSFHMTCDHHIQSQ